MITNALVVLVPTMDAVQSLINVILEEEIVIMTLIVKEILFVASIIVKETFILTPQLGIGMTTAVSVGLNNMGA